MLRLRVRRPQADNDHPSAELSDHDIRTDVVTTVYIQPFENKHAMIRRYQMTGHILAANPHHPGLTTDLSHMEPPTETDAIEGVPSHYAALPQVRTCGRFSPRYRGGRP